MKRLLTFIVIAAIIVFGAYKCTALVTDMAEKFHAHAAKIGGEANAE